MNQKQKQLLRQIFNTAFKGDIDVILDKNISPYMNKAQVILPKIHKYKKVKIIIYKDK